MDQDIVVFSPFVKIIGHSMPRGEAIEDLFDFEGIDYLNGKSTAKSLVERANVQNMNPETLIEFGGRLCYASWETGRDLPDYIHNIVESGHGSVLEHVTVNFAISGISRSLSHELVRHRAGVAISQASQRYIDASDVRFVIPPIYLRDETSPETFQKNLDDFRKRCYKWKKEYKKAQKECLKIAHSAGFTGTKAKKSANEAARHVLPNATETKLLWTLNYRTLRHIYSMRCNEHVEPEFRRLVDAVRNSFEVALGRQFTFDDVEFTASSEKDGYPVATVKHNA